MKPDSLKTVRATDDARAMQLAQALATSAGIDDVAVFLGLAAATVQYENQLAATEAPPPTPAATEPCTGSCGAACRNKG